MSAGWDVALEQIEAADLPCPVYRTARRLLDRAAANGGSVAMAEAAFKALCQVEAEGTMRSHLVQLAAAGIIRYKRRGFVTVNFLAWMVDDEILIAQRSLLSQDEETRALSDQIDGELDEDLIAERSNFEDEAPIRALSDQKARAERSNSASTSHARSGRWVGRSLPNTNKRKKPTYPPTSQKPPRTESQQLAFELLTDGDVGVIHRVADDLARKLPLPDIYRTVDRWLPDQRERDVGTGALVTRLRDLQPSSAETVKLSATFRDSELFRRHRLPDEMVADAERKNYSLDNVHLDDPERRRKYSL